MYIFYNLNATVNINFGLITVIIDYNVVSRASLSKTLGLLRLLVTLRKYVLKLPLTVFKHEQIL